jgi:Na+-translocating ferredoxin:NAD+ oxidoreductase subunit G
MGGGSVRDILRMIVVLTIIGAVSGLALAAISRLTAGPIEYQTIKFVKEPAVKKVLTGYDNDPILDRKKLQLGTDPQGRPVELTVFPATKGGELFAVAVEGFGKGFHGQIGVMVGVSKEGKILDIGITSHSETPGIGSKVTETGYTDRYQGLPAKKGVAVDAISGATYSSKGVVAAVNEAAELVEKFREEIF